MLKDATQEVQLIEWDLRTEMRAGPTLLSSEGNWKCGDIKPQEEKIATRRTGVFHAFNPSTQEAEVGRSL